jgi:hypothetical protein
LANTITSSYILFCSIALLYHHARGEESLPKRILIQHQIHLVHPSILSATRAARVRVRV